MRMASDPGGLCTEVARAGPRATTTTVDRDPAWSRHRSGRPARSFSPSTHKRDEVRFSWKAVGLFCWHLGEEVLLVFCERND